MDVERCREQFPSLGRVVGGQPVAYFDGPGGTQVPARVIDAVAGYYRTSNANARGLFAASVETDQVIAASRAALAALLGALPAGAARVPGAGTISLGPNMTTLCFQLAHAVGRGLHPGDELVVTDLDHDANVAPWRMLAERGAVVRSAPLTLPQATLDMAALRGLIGERTRLVAVGWAANSVGTVNELAAVRAWTREVGALLVVDAVHWVPHGVVDVAALDPDFLLCSAYKFFGPHVGVLYARPGALERIAVDKVRPQRDRAPERIETGTLNHAALAGVTAAVEFIADLVPDHAQPLRQRLIDAMGAVAAHERELFLRLAAGLEEIHGVRLYGPPADACPRAPTAAFTVAGVHPAEVARVLAARAIAVWSGHFYAPTLVERLGLAASGGLVRAGLAPYTTAAEVDRLLEAVAAVARATR
jgi:cysteine desulfurase family protein (TIGR01976 family)